MTFEAEFTGSKISYTITWKVGEAITTDTLEYGTVIIAPTETPTKDSTDEFEYTFSGWKGLTDDMMVTGDVTFEAEFTGSKISYTITIADGITVKDGEIEIASDESFAYGTTLTVTVVDPEAVYTYIISANGDDVLDETYTVVGDVSFTVVRTFNLDELGAFIENEDAPRIEISKDAADEVISKDILRKLGDNKTLVIDVVEDGEILYSWTLSKYDETKNGTFNVSILEVAEPDEALIEALESKNVKKSLVLEFAATGELPMKATIKYNVGDNFEEGATLILFFYEDVTLTKVQSNLTVENGYVEFSPSHFSTYVLAELDSESGSVGNNTLLYVGVGIIIVIIALFAIVALRRP